MVTSLQLLLLQLLLYIITFHKTKSRHTLPKYEFLNRRNKSFWLIFFRLYVIYFND